MKSLAIAALILASSVMHASAQSLSAADLQKLVDERIANINPYQSVLNDPDPERSRIAMQIMLESGDAALVRMALEFGILSPNPTVKRVALEAWLATGPILTFSFDTLKLQGNNVKESIRNNWNGVLAENVGYWRIPVGPFLEEKKCFVQVGGEGCFITVNSDGVFLTPERMNARASVSETGVLEGVATVNGNSESVPISIRLID